MVSAWGGYVFIINLIPLHVFVLLLMGRYSPRLLTSYSTFFILGLLLSMQIPFVGFQPIRTSEHMAALGVFALLITVGFLRYLQSVLSRNEFKKLFLIGGLLAAGFVFLSVVTFTMMGVIAPWSGRFYSLWDTGYAKIHIPIIASVSEHQPTTWFSFFFDRSADISWNYGNKTSREKTGARRPQFFSKQVCRNRCKPTKHWC